MSPVDRQGEMFAGYLIEISLGRGGMSEVYRAKNPRLGNLVAIKMLAPELTEDRLFRERFIRESQIAASLDHPNVIPIHDAGEEDGVPYIAMRYVDGPDLGVLIRRGQLLLEHIVSIVAQVASALDAAHERGLIHRDVKPANVLIDRYVGVDSVPHVYLSDFGIAKHAVSQSGLTSTGQFVGTIDYVAPEQIEGKQVDRRTDVYSLGCVLYECITGAKPYVRETNVAVMYAHLLEPPPIPSELRPGIPPELDAVVARALAKSRDERYATCGELAAAARAPFARPSAPTKTMAAPERQRVATTLAKPIPVPPTAPAPVPLLESPQVPEARTTGRSRRIPRPLLAAAVLLALGGLGFAAVNGLMDSTPSASPGTTSTIVTTVPRDPKPPPPPPRPVLLPRFIGANQSFAVRRLQTLGLRAKVTRTFAPIRKNAVFAQAPSKGSRVTKGSLVRLTISNGPRPKPAPPPPPPPPPPPQPPPPSQSGTCYDRFGRVIECGGGGSTWTTCTDRFGRKYRCRR